MHCSPCARRCVQVWHAICSTYNEEVAVKLLDLDALGGQGQLVRSLMPQLAPTESASRLWLG